MRLASLLLLPAILTSGQTARNVLVVVNQASPLSKSIGDYYILKRHVPLANLCKINVRPVETIERAEYQKKIAASVAGCLRGRHLEEQILYIFTTAGVPLRVDGTKGPGAESASVDSELTLLYSDLHGPPHRLAGSIPNPFFGKTESTFNHREFPIYLVTRLAAYDFAGVKAMIDRALEAQNRGKFVIDLKASDDTLGNTWLREAAHALPSDRVIFDDSKTVLSQQNGVIGYASWGSNDPDRKQRLLGFHWLPGAIMTEFVSTNARTFARPPDTWNLGSWGEPGGWFAGSPQTLTADYLQEGATGASGHVDEPYLNLTPRPNILLPAYYRGRNLAESYYLAMPVLSWMNVVAGDPLCALGKP